MFSRKKTSSLNAHSTIETIFEEALPQKKEGSDGGKNRLIIGPQCSLDGPSP